MFCAERVCAATGYSASQMEVCTASPQTYCNSNRSSNRSGGRSSNGSVGKSNNRSCSFSRTSIGERSSRGNIIGIPVGRDSNGSNRRVGEAAGYSLSDGGMYNEPANVLQQQREKQQ